MQPAQHFVVATKREKCACKRREEGGVAAAPAPARIIEKEPEFTARFQSPVKTEK